jgi:hypothetical protein
MAELSLLYINRVQRENCGYVVCLLFENQGRTYTKTHTRAHTYEPFLPGLSPSHTYSPNHEGYWI